MSNKPDVSKMNGNPHDGNPEEEMLAEKWAKDTLAKYPAFASMVKGKEYVLDIFTDGAAIPANDILQVSSCLLGMTRMGKTNALAVFLEALTRVNASYSVLDFEGDIYTIADIFPQVKVLKINPKWPAEKIRKLARWVILSRGQLILKFDQSSSAESKRFFELIFLGQLYDTADELYDKGLAVPHLHVVDEAPFFFPNTTKMRSTERHQSELVNLGDLVARTGQKRGLGIMVATTRPSGLNTDLLSQMKVRALMRVIEETDIKRYRTSLRLLENRETKVGKIIRTVISLGVGECVYAPNKGKPFTARFKLRESRHISKTPGIEDYWRLDSVKKEPSEMLSPEEMVHG